MPAWISIPLFFFGLAVFVVAWALCRASRRWDEEEHELWLKRFYENDGRDDD